MEWALVFHPDQFIAGRLVQPPRPIPEASGLVAVGQGWVVLGQDSAFVPANVDVNLQSGPRRVADDE